MFLLLAHASPITSSEGRRKCVEKLILNSCEPQFVNRIFIHMKNFEEPLSLHQPNGPMESPASNHLQRRCELDALQSLKLMNTKDNDKLRLGLCEGVFWLEKSE